MQSQHDCDFEFTSATQLPSDPQRAAPYLIFEIETAFADEVMLQTTARCCQDDPPTDTR